MGGKGSGTPPARFPPGRRCKWNTAVNRPAAPPGGGVQDFHLADGAQADILLAPPGQGGGLLAEHALAGAGRVRQYGVEPFRQPAAQRRHIAGRYHRAAHAAAPRFCISTRARSRTYSLHLAVPSPEHGGDLGRFPSGAAHRSSTVLRDGEPAPSPLTERRAPAYSMPRRDGGSAPAFQSPSTKTHRGRKARGQRQGKLFLQLFGRAFQRINRSPRRSGSS